MVDQANRLRSMVQTKSDVFAPSSSISSRVITVTSGKGGVGKTNFTVNLAIYLQKQNKRVVIIDADFGLANIEILFGIIPKNSLADVLMGGKSIPEVLTEGPMGIKFISGGSGFRELANITEKQMAYLVESFSVLDSISDVILIDTGAGISNSVINFIKASNEAIIVTTPEPTSITDAYSLIKTMKENNKNEKRTEEMNEIANGNVYLPEFKIVLNRVEDISEGADIFNKLDRVSKKFLDVELQYLGSIPHDNSLVKAVKRQQPAVTAYPNSDFAKSLEKIGNNLLNIPEKQQTGFKSFFKRLAGVFNS